MLYESLTKNQCYVKDHVLSSFRRQKIQQHRKCSQRQEQCQFVIGFLPYLMSGFNNEPYCCNNLCHIPCFCLLNYYSLNSCAPPRLDLVWPLKVYYPSLCNLFLMQCRQRTYNQTLNMQNTDNSSSNPHATHSICLQSAAQQVNLQQSPSSAHRHNDSTFTKQNCQSPINSSQNPGSTSPSLSDCFMAPQSDIALQIQPIMMNQRQLRRDKIEGIKKSLRAIKIISKNSLQVEAKQQKNRNRRQSLQLADSLLSERLLRKYSDEDQEEDRNNLNTFNQKYILLDMIGEGANARVHRCEYKESKKVYAVKIISMDEEHILELKKNFINIKQLRQYSIIKYHALYFDLKKGVAFLVMEHFPYPNLKEITIADQSELKLIFSELFKAVSYIHQRNICHRDIKPENVLYDREAKRIKVIDFGISKRTFQRGARRDMLTIIGTSLYLAPEILMGGGYDERVDMWSIGATLYQLVAGVTPFESEYHSDTINNIVKGVYTFDPIAWSNYSYFVKDLVTRLLKPKKERLTIKEALRHLWFGIELKSPPIKQRRGSQDNEFRSIPRHDTFCIKIHEAFHEEEFYNRKNAISKEQGQENQSFGSNESRKFVINRRLNLIENKEFDLDDSDQEQRSPSTVTSRGAIIEQSSIII